MFPSVHPGAFGRTLSRAFLSLMVWWSATAAVAQVYSEDFDGVVPPALPPGWVNTSVSGPDSWVTAATQPDSPPNNAYLSVTAFNTEYRLETPPIPIATSSAQLAFRHMYAFAVDLGSLPECPCPIGFGYLEISIGGAPFQLIQSWEGQSGIPIAYVSVAVNLPTTAAGQTVTLRWRLVTNFSPNAALYGFWWLDSIQICDGYPCDAVPLPRQLSIGGDLNGVWEPGETVELDPEFLNNGVSSIHPLGTAVSLTGPGDPGNYAINDGSADYGDIPENSLGSCASTGNCYTVQESSGVRQAPHWDAQFSEMLDTGLPVTWAVHLGGSFADVPSSNLFYRDIETVFHRGVTGGCGGENYCPGGAALRKQMAVFLLKSKYGPAYVPPTAAGIFTDVPASDPFAPWVENLYDLGITGGCSVSPLMYCPDQAVLRKQMAVFLLKTLSGSDYLPPVCLGVFTDVLCPSLFADWIEDLYARAIAAGCGGGLYCPDSSNTRGQMAVFLVKTFGLKLYAP